jgi:hypothetical protein
MARNRATITISKPRVTCAIAIADLFTVMTRSARAQPRCGAPRRRVRGASMKVLPPAGEREVCTCRWVGAVRSRLAHVHFNVVPDRQAVGVRKKPDRAPLAAAPRQHAPGKPPTGGAPPPRTGVPVASAPSTPQPARVPAQRPVGKVPNPRKPKLVQDVRGGVLQDLFEIFPDLPRPRRPPLSRRGPGAAKRG